VPVDEKAEVTDAKHVIVTPRQWLQKVLGPVTNLAKFRFDALSGLWILLVQPLRPTLGEKDLGRLHVVECDDLTVGDLFARDVVIS